MDFSRYFLRPEGRLRTGWRVGIFLLLFAGVYVATSVIAAFLFEHPTIVASVLTLTVATVLSTWMVLRWLERKPFATVGLHCGRQAAREVIEGCLVGGGLACGAVAIEWGLGLISLQPTGLSLQSAAADGVLVLLLLAVAASTEELLFRGYAFQQLIEGNRIFGPILVLSSLFGLVHLMNPHSTVMSTANTVLAGVLLSLAYVRTRALWLPIGWHYAWNATLAVTGLPVSGLNLIQTPWGVLPVSDKIWLYGGAYGPEGGAVATVLLVLGIGYFGWRLPAND